MLKENIDKILKHYSIEAKRIFGYSLKVIILFGSCARGDYDNESDIDILVLLDIFPEELPEARRKMRPIADMLDLKYDVVISAIFQNYQIFYEYKDASGFYQNVEREGLIIE